MSRLIERLVRWNDRIDATGDVRALSVLRILLGPIVLLHLSRVVSGTMLFLAGTGLYFSARFKRTTTAVVANFSLIAFVWLLLPILTAFISNITTDKYFEAVVTVNPVVQAGVVMFGDSGSENVGLSLSQLEYKWPWRDTTSFASTTTLVMITALAYAAAGFLFAWRAKKRFRKNIF